MFWDAITDGFAPLAHWQTWLVMLGHFVVCLAVPFAGGLLMGREEAGAVRQGLGCLLGTVGHMVAVGVATAVAVVLLMPILWGYGEFGSPSALVQNAWTITKHGLGGILTACMFACIPVLGPWIADTQGFTIYIVSVFVFRAAVTPAVIAAGGNADSSFPGFWTAAGFGVFAWVLIFLMQQFIRTEAANVAERSERSARTAISAVGLTAAGAAVLAGFLPFFMYASYARLSTQHELAQPRTLEEAIQVVRDKLSATDKFAEADAEAAAAGFTRLLKDGSLSKDKMDLYFRTVILLSDLQCEHAECLVRSWEKNAVVRSERYDQICREALAAGMSDDQLATRDRQIADAARREGVEFTSSEVPGVVLKVAEPELRGVFERARRERDAFQEIARRVRLSTDAR